MLLHLPAHTPPGRYPLVVVLHGGTGSPASAERDFGFDALADREGFAVVYPFGLDGHWNDGRVGNDARDVDDVAYISGLIDQLADAYPIDRERVFATGYSNGGLMSYRLGCELASKLAAIAPVCGQVPSVLTCQPARPISLLAINGTDDPIVLWNGGEVRGHRGAIRATAASLELFVRADGCAAEPAITDEPDRDPTDGTTVRRHVYSGCGAGTAVELVEIDHGGHTWPGTSRRLPAEDGLLSRELDASSDIWRFFAAHGR